MCIMTAKLVFVSLCEKHLDPILTAKYYFKTLHWCMIRVGKDFEPTNIVNDIYIETSFISSIQ